MVITVAVFVIFVVGFVAVTVFRAAILVTAVFRIVLFVLLVFHKNLLTINRKRERV